MIFAVETPISEIVPFQLPRLGLSLGLGLASTPYSILYIPSNHRLKFCKVLWVQFARLIRVRVSVRVRVRVND